MSLEVMIYLASVSDSLRILFFALFAFCAVPSVIFLLMWLDMKEDDAKKAFLRLVVLASVSFFLHAVTPSKETIYLIAATKASKEFIQSKGVNQLYDKTLLVLENKLDEQINNIGKDKKYWQAKHYTDVSILFDQNDGNAGQQFEKLVKRFNRRKVDFFNI